MSLSPAGIGLALCQQGPDRRDSQFDALIVPEADSHSEALVPAIDQLLRSCGLTPTQLTGLAFDAGPGGFTRVRVACAVAQGIALGLGRPIAAVDSLQALAMASAWQTSRASGARVAVVVDARMSEYYVGTFQVPAALSCSLGTIIASSVLPRDQLAAWLDAQEAELICGDVVPESPHRASMADFAINSRSIGWPDARLLLEAITVLAGSELAPFLPAEQAHPLYVRNKVALNVTEQAQLRGS